MKVVTYNGREEKREDCVFIRGKYYHKERDCFLYNGIHYSPFSRYLVVDHETGTRAHTAANSMAFGVVGHSKADGFKFGYFSSNITRNGSILLPKEVKDEEIVTVIEGKNIGNNDPAAISGEEQPRRRREGDRVVAFSPDDEEDSGYADRMPSPDVVSKARRARLMKCMDVWGFLKDGFITSASSDVIAKIEDVKLYDKEYSGVKFNAQTARNQYAFNLAYNSEVMMQVFQKAYDGVVVPKKELELYDRISKFFNGRTFGIEYESWDGRVPTYIAASGGIIPLRDGSLRHDGICGYEYASVVMEGSKGLAVIKNQCDMLKEFTTFNEKCSVHIHIGNIPRNPENLVKLYTALYTIQDSLYSLYPSCLQKTSAYKQKDYCSPLPRLSNGELTANNIVQWLSDGTEKYSSFGRNHPKDSSAQHKWNINSRYSIFNLNNFYYTDRGTVECRVSTPTFNASKVVALLLINMLIVNNAVEGKYFSSVEELIKASIPDESLRAWILAYVEYRKTVLSKWSTVGGVMTYQETFQNDNEIGTTRPLL